MKTPALKVLLPLAGLVLAGCSQTTAQNDLFQNPLYERFYYQDLANHMAEYTIQNDPILKDTGKKGIVDSTRDRAMEHIANANGKISSGKSGGFISDTDYASGTALMLGGKIFFSQDFNTVPGPSLRVFASTILDPRGESGSVVTFPNDVSVDIGALQSPYGPQAYVLPTDKGNLPFRSVVIWDTRLKRLFGFAQLNQ